MSPMGPLGGLVNLPSRTAVFIVLTNFGIQAPNFKSRSLALYLTCCICLSLSLIFFRMLSSSCLYTIKDKNQSLKTISNCEGQ